MSKQKATDRDILYLKITRKNNFLDNYGPLNIFLKTKLSSSIWLDKKKHTHTLLVSI